MSNLVPESEQQYGSILTVLGENAEQNGKLLNKQIEFTHIAFGDANDTYVQPDRKNQALVNELHRIPVNSVDVLQPTPDSVPILKVEAILPDEINDVVIREFAAVATFNGQTYFHAIGNCARVYVPKPINNGNVSNPVTLEMTFVITSAEPIVEIDPNVITASRSYVHNIAGNLGDEIVDGKIHPENPSEYLLLGDQETAIPAKVTRLRVKIAGEVNLLYMWNADFDNESRIIENISENSFRGFDVTVRGVSKPFEFAKGSVVTLRQSNDIAGWAPVFDGATDISPAILKSMDYVRGTENRDLICSRGNGFINSEIIVNDYININFGSNKIIAGENMHVIVRRGSGFDCHDIRLGEDGLTVNKKPLLEINTDDGPIFLQGSRRTRINAGIDCKHDKGVHCRLAAIVKADEEGSAGISGCDVDVKSNRGRSSVEIVADNTADPLRKAYVNSNRIKCHASASLRGIYEIYNSDESVTDRPENVEIAENVYFVEYQTTNGGYAVPLNSLGDRHTIDGQIWDLHIASNKSNIRILGDGCNVLSPSFPTEESGQLVLKKGGVTPNMMGGMGGTSRSRSYSHIVDRTHCKYLGDSRETTDLMSAVYCFLETGYDMVISGNDYLTGKKIHSKYVPKEQFILNGDIKMEWEMMGAVYEGDKFGLGLRINGTTYGTLRTSGQTPDGFDARLHIHFSSSDNRVDIMYIINNERKVIGSQSVPDLSANGASVEVWGFADDGTNPAGRAMIYGLDGNVRYKYA